MSRAVLIGAACVFGLAAIAPLAPMTAPAQMVPNSLPVPQRDDPTLPKPRAKPTAIGLAAGEFTVLIEGSKQGRFKSEGTTDTTRDRIVGFEYTHDLGQPTDKDGVPSGKSRHLPIMFTKEWGAASPQIFQAAANGETLKSVTFEFYQPGVSGGLEHFYTVKLTNAVVSHVRQRMVAGRDVEDVWVTFQKIEVEHRGSKTRAED
ncbi:MAG: type VI secretion system tube protein Hcp [Phycisphaerales bacterium]|nr:type VI secretion system tube protein Hcp [Phycisphaerales bacterium]